VAAQSVPDDKGFSLALAMVVSSAAPLLLLDGEARIVAASATFCAAFDLECAGLRDCTLYDLGNGEWDVPQLRTLLEATSTGDADVPAYELQLKRPGRPTLDLVLNAKKLNYAEGADIRLLLTVADVTAAKASASQARDHRFESDQLNAALTRDNALLAQEINHRIANSLQIIASLIMLNARRTSSEEARGHLSDAHHRVLSVAQLQHQLAISGSGDVEVRSYFGRLCDSISASMIADPRALQLTVEADDAVVDAGVAVSLGLIVTELVINALKHAFPTQDAGSIVVSYRADAAGWRLSVKDDGVGMPAPGSPADLGGLATSIIEALARQLRAKIEIVALQPGVVVSVVHAAATSLTAPEAALTVPV
jgi:two-component system, sensor histidine kinase PdtaS